MLFVYSSNIKIVDISLHSKIGAKIDQWKAIWQVVWDRHTERRTDQLRACIYHYSAMYRHFKKTEHQQQPIWKKNKKTEILYNPGLSCSKLG